MKQKIKLCNNCSCMTKTKEGTIYICGKCGKDRRNNNSQVNYPTLNPDGF